MIICVIALFVVTALAVSIRDAPNMRLFLIALACALFVVSLVLGLHEKGNPSLGSIEFWKMIGALVMLTLFGAAAGASARRG